MKTLNIHFILLALLVASFNGIQSVAQESTETASRTQPRERIVVRIEHIPVDIMQDSLLSISQGLDIKVVGEPHTNKLVVDAPKDAIPGALGLIREMDRPQPMVRVDVIEAVFSPDEKVKLEADETRLVLAALEKMEKDGVAKVVDRIRIEAAGNTKSEIQVGAQTPITTSRVTRGGGAASKSYSYQQVGTVFTCTPRVSTNGVLLDFLFEKSEISEVDGEDPAATISSKISSVVRIPMGEAIVVGGMRTGPDDKPVHWRLIISATVDDAK